MNSIGTIPLPQRPSVDEVIMQLTTEMEALRSARSTTQKRVKIGLDQPENIRILSDHLSRQGAVKWPNKNAIFSTYKRSVTEYQRPYVDTQ